MLQVIILVKNEAENLQKCLPNLKFADSILVIDDYSTDNSEKVAASFGAKVTKRHLNGDFAKSRNFALTQTKADWVLFVDADEIIPPKLQSEIKKLITKNDSGGFYIRRLDFFKNQPLHHGDTGNTWLLRLQKKPFTVWEGMVHEVWTPKEKSFRLKNLFYHYPHPTIYSFLNSLNNYSDIRASELFARKISTNIFEIIIYPIGKFFNLYVIKKGILDGTVGFIHAMLMSFYSFLVRGKLYLIWRKDSQPI